MNIDYENEIYKKVYQNSIIFLKDGIHRLINQDDINKETIDYELLILTCTSFQISLELAMNALLIEKKGLSSIIPSTVESTKLIRQFKNNKLKTKSFEDIKKIIKKEKYVEDFNKEHYNIISKFQKYRNKIVHFSYNFKEEEVKLLRDEILFYLIYIIVKILEKKTDRPSEFFEYILGGKLHSEIIKYQPYINAMKTLAEMEGGDIFKCIICSNRTFNSNERYCYCCNFYGDLFNMVKCNVCKKENAVIYDNMNIEYNDNKVYGTCMNCDSRFLVYECPKCDKIYVDGIMQKNKKN